jgi:serine/threonine-protein kinase
MPKPSAPHPAPAAAPAPVASAGNQGILRVNSRPWSQVFIDGRMIGNTPQLNVPLSPGKHKVKLVNPQLNMSKGFDVTIQAGKPTTKIVELIE